MDNKTHIPNEYKFTIVQTTDVHSMIFPYNFMKDKEENTSMAHVYSYVKKLRDEGKTVLLLDDGDFLPGQPAVYYYNFVATNETHIWSEILNYMEYDAVVLGNHDIEAGHDVYDKINKEIKAPLLAANLIDENTKEPYFKPYTIVEKKGVKIAVLGLIEPAIERQLPKVLYYGLETEDMVESARKWIKVIKEKEKPDMIIGLFHSGANHTEDKEKYKNENASQLVAEEVDGFDLILVGHDHQGWLGLGYDEISKKKTKEVRNSKGKIIPIFGGVNSARYIVSIDVFVNYNEENKICDIQFDGILLEPSVEELIRKSIRQTSSGAFLALDPQSSRRFLKEVGRALGKRNRNLVIIASIDIRRYVRRLIETEFYNVPVLDYQELTPEISVQPIDRVRM